MDKRDSINSNFNGVEKRRNDIPGRRKTDAHTCIFHQDMKDQTVNCFIAVKDRIKTLESKMGSTITIKIAGIITTVAMGFMILFLGSAFNMMRDLKLDLKSVEKNTGEIEKRFDSVFGDQIRMNAKQENIISIIAEIKDGQNQIKDKISEIQSDKNSDR